MQQVIAEIPPGQFRDCTVQEPYKVLEPDTQQGPEPHGMQTGPVRATFIACFPAGIHQAQVWTNGQLLVGW